MWNNLCVSVCVCSAGLLWSYLFHTLFCSPLLLASWNSKIVVICVSSAPWIIDMAMCFAVTKSDSGFFFIFFSNSHCLLCVWVHLRGTEQDQKKVDLHIFQDAVYGPDLLIFKIKSAKLRALQKDFAHKACSWFAGDQIQYSNKHFASTAVCASLSVVSGARPTLQTQCH